METLHLPDRLVFTYNENKEVVREKIEDKDFVPLKGSTKTYKDDLSELKKPVTNDTVIDPKKDNGARQCP